MTTGIGCWVNYFFCVKAGGGGKSAGMRAIAVFIQPITELVDRTRTTIYGNAMKRAEKWNAEEPGAELSFPGSVLCAKEALSSLIQNLRLTYENTNIQNQWCQYPDLRIYRAGNLITRRERKGVAGLGVGVCDGIERWRAFGDKACAFVRQSPGCCHQD